jgi:D-alanine-D-alanine ligase
LHCQASWKARSLRVQSSDDFAAEQQLRIAVLFGGISNERDVSVATAAQVTEALRARGHEVLAVEACTGLVPREQEQQVFGGTIDVHPPGESPASESALPVILAGNAFADLDLIFIAMHGGSGEDGTIQSLLELTGIPYTGSAALGSAMAMDKDVAKRLFRANRIPTPRWLMAPADSEEIERQLGFPLIVKPNGEGSTVGLSLVTAADQVEEAVASASRFGGGVMLEEYIPGRELTVGVLDEQALAVGEIFAASGDIFDYSAKYQAGVTTKIFPAEITDAQTTLAQQYALGAHHALKLSSYSRVDFRLNAAGELWCLEVNTLPGLTPGSLLPKSAAALGITFPELCERICRGGLRHSNSRDG